MFDLMLAMSEIGRYSTGEKPPWFVPIIGFFILFVIAVKVAPKVGWIGWLITVFLYYSGILGFH